jgi:hypothetical protein
LTHFKPLKKWRNMKPYARNMKQVTVRAQFDKFEACQEVAYAIRQYDKDADLGIREGRGKYGPWLMAGRFFVSDDANQQVAVTSIRLAIEYHGGQGAVKAR